MSKFPFSGEKATILVNGRRVEGFTARDPQRTMDSIREAASEDPALWALLEVHGLRFDDEELDEDLPEAAHLKAPPDRADRL